MNPYLRAVPNRYHRVAGLLNFVSKIDEPSSAPYTRLFDGKSTVRSMPPAASCLLREADAHVLVFENESPKLFESILQLGQALRAGGRLAKYLAAFKSYESITSAPDIELAAVRHAIGHSRAALSRPKTVQALRTLFGDVTIDLDRAAHRRVFYAQLGRLFIVVDELIADELRTGRSRWYRTPEGLFPAYEGYIAYALHRHSADGAV